MKFYSYYNQLKERVAAARGIPTHGSVNIEDLSRLTNRAIQVTCLELLLCEYRKRNATQYNELEGKKALYHKLLTKYQWPLEVIRALSLEDIFLSLHDELNLNKFDSDVAQFFERTSLNYESINFADYQESDWDPEFYLKFPEMLR